MDYVISLYTDKLIQQYIEYFIPDTGSIQTCPQPLLQHLLLPVHVWSLEHSSAQVPICPSGTAGHWPGFGPIGLISRCILQLCKEFIGYFSCGQSIVGTLERTKFIYSVTISMLNVSRSQSHLSDWRKLYQSDLDEKGSDMPVNRTKNSLGSGVTHTRPQPLLQHLELPSQWASFSHSWLHIPTVPGWTAGHTPSFTTAIAKQESSLTFYDVHQVHCC